MRVSREQAEQNRLAVLKSAARLFRDRGFDGVGIADIMQAAGLTHGGFYGQFSSKEHLAAEASSRTFAATAGKWDKVIAGADGDAVEALAEFYLTTEHRDHRANGCPIAALASDAARAGPSVQAAFKEGVTGHLERMQRAVAQRTGGAATDRDEALRALSTIVGALILSRAVGDTDLSRDFLSAAREHLRYQPDG